MATETDTLKNDMNELRDSLDKLTKDVAAIGKSVTQDAKSRAAIEVWKAFAREGGQRPPEFLSTHPAPGNRIDHLESLMPKVMPTYRRNAA
jgi:Zn-dependent protease with chaperone function